MNVKISSYSQPYGMRKATNLYYISYQLNVESLADILNLHLCTRYFTVIQREFNPPPWLLIPLTGLPEMYTGVHMADCHLHLSYNYKSLLAKR